MTNTGRELEKEVCEKIIKLVENNEFLVTHPNVVVLEKPRYFSKDRNTEIEFDVSIEKYLENPSTGVGILPSLIIIVECKDYAKSISVDDVEEFHAKLEQIGADKTKGIMITKEAIYQKATLEYAKSKGITLARILPDNKIEYVLFHMMPWEFEQKRKQENSLSNRIKALTNEEYSTLYGQTYYDTLGSENFEKLIQALLERTLNP